MSRVFRRGRGNSFGLVLLTSQIFQLGVKNIPPITLSTIFLNVVIYLRLIPSLPNVNEACTSNSLVFHKRQWKRICYSSFYHLDDMHLYFNMISFLWKGIYLEQKLKSRKFLLLVVIFSVFTQVVMLGINQMLAELLSSKYYLQTCAAGFSAVCFAVKVVTTVNSDDNESIMGIRIPSRYAYWVELLVIQMLVPNASFTGHLAGIIVGLMYTHGPISKFINILDGIFPGSRRYTYKSGHTGGRQTTRRRRSISTDDEDEQLQQAIRESLRQSQLSATASSSEQPPPYGWNIPADHSTHSPVWKNRRRQDDDPRSRKQFENIYPNLSERSGYDDGPSSRRVPPLYETAENRKPSAPPYPIDDYDQDFDSFATNNKCDQRDPSEENREKMRNARLRKLKKR